MKRVQAIVSGKKKQCTKLPKPSLKEKKSGNAPEASSPGPSRSSPGEKGAKGDGTKSVATSGGSSTTVTAGGSGSTTTTASSSRVTSKIPGNSPKKGSRDGGGGTTSSKGQQRTGTHSVSKSGLFSKKSKDKTKSEYVSVSAGESIKTEDSGPKLGQKMTSLKDPGYIRQNHYADESRDADTSDQASEEEKRASPSSVTLPPPATDPGPSQHEKLEEKARQDQRLQANISTGSSKHNDQDMVPPKQSQSQENQRTIQQPQGLQPLHGILKDSSSSTESTHSTNVNYYQNGVGHSYNVPLSLPREYPTARQSQPAHKTSSLKSNTDSYQHAYGSLPRNSRTTTPTPENAYNYGSFPRRSHLSSPTQHSVLYNSGTLERGSLSHKSESDSVFPMGSLERDFSSGRSNYSVANKNYGVTGYSNDNYAVLNHSYHTHRSGSSDPRTSSYLMARGLPVQYNSDTETVRYHREQDGYSRGVRAGSVPLGYESDSGAYRLVGQGQSRFGSIPQSLEVGSTMGAASASSLRVHPDDEQYRAAPGRKPVPRRHTVGASTNRIDSMDTVRTLSLVRS